MHIFRRLRKANPSLWSQDLHTYVVLRVLPLPSATNTGTSQRTEYQTLRLFGRQTHCLNQANELGFLSECLFVENQ